MNIQPIGERVLIRPIKSEDRTAGGIYLPESAKEEKKEGQIVSVGEVKGLLRVGDKVIYGGYSSEEIELNGVKHVIVELKDVVAKII